ncbi:MAG: L-lysine 6-transaminase [Deltaproteobacteria bacterium]|nr:L-lysine 6-transaminase [Deltaproteobacteria bacterium]
MSRFQVPPAEVIPNLQKHILVDGFHVIIDLEKSKGSYIHDAVTGKDILDFYSYFASLPVGHNHPRLASDPDFMQALTRAALANPSNSDIYCPEYAYFVEQFAKHAMPAELKYLFFVAGGAPAIENALKTAFDWKIRKNRAAGKGDKGTKILHFREAFHGRSGYTMSLTNTDPIKTDLFPKFDWPRVTNPKLQFPITDAELKRVAEEEKKAVAEIEQAFAKNPDDIAAIIIEPIQGEGGDNHFRKEFFVELRRLADKHDALLIFDEVQTGGGLTGKLWCYQHFEVTPDIVAFGKKFQVCGIMVGPRVDQVPDNVFKVSSRINSTWGGNLVDMVRCIKYLEIIREEKLVEHAAAMGEKMLGGLHAIAKKYPVITNVRGQGLFVAFTFPTSAERNAVRQACWDLGLATLSSGSTSIRFRPCLNVSATEIDKALEILERALAQAIGQKRAAG